MPELGDLGPQWNAIQANYLSPADATVASLIVIGAWAGVGIGVYFAGTAVAASTSIGTTITIGGLTYPMAGLTAGQIAILELLATGSLDSLQAQAFLEATVATWELTVVNSTALSSLGAFLGLSGYSATGSIPAYDRMGTNIGPSFTVSVPGHWQFNPPGQNGAGPLGEWVFYLE